MQTSNLPPTEEVAGLSGPESEEKVEDLDEAVNHRNRVVFALAGTAAFGFLGWMAFNMPVGEPTSPGPGFFPLVVCGIGLIASLLVLLESVLALREGKRPHRIERTSARSWCFVGALVVFAVLIPVIGLYVSAVVFSVVSIRIIGDLSWLKTIAYGVLLGGVTAFLALEFLDLRIQELPWG